MGDPQTGNSVIGIVSVYATFADAEEAERIGRAMVGERLAACINILGEVRSIYRWQGEVENATECAAVLKTSAAGADRLVRRIVELHSYENPAVTVWPVGQVPAAYAVSVVEQKMGYYNTTLENGCFS